jgi:hypothetical protein
MTLGQVITPMVGILILAAVVEALVEYLAEPIVGWIYKQFAPDRTVPESLPALRYVSAAVGVLLCVLYGADLLATMGVVTSVPYVGAVVTGLLIGRGANFINDFVSRWRE